MNNDNRFQTKSLLLANSRIQGDYFHASFSAPSIANAAQPGQFIHVRIPELEHRVLRRPFSIYDVDDNSVHIIYTVVGEGTQRLSHLSSGTEIDIMGPLGNPFTPLPADSAIVAGGYGCAATYLLARRAEAKPIVLIGGRTAGDILLKKEYEALGCDVRISTDDGSMGTEGRVTSIIPDNIKWLASCGPIPMLKALAAIMSERKIDGELSMDHAICCGVGACFACVTKVKADTPDGWRYARICSEGPVFRADSLVF
jgi:dihydroorotate dehydrogenase electron transfer subunit